MAAPSTDLENVIIIGGGCAGLTAAIYAARANLAPTVFVGTLEYKSGLLAKTSIVENYPGFPDGILGYDLMENMEKQAVKYGAKIIEKFATELRVLPDAGGFEVVCGEQVMRSRTAIVATGSSPNKLGLPREDEFWSKGISSCAVCDGALYRNKKIIVVGGGDSAMEEALFLTKFSTVTLIHRSTNFRASQVMIARLKANPKITLRLNSVITAFEGDAKGITHINVKNVLDNSEELVPVDGLFYGLGLTPNTVMFKGLLEMDETGYIHAHDTKTNIPGLYVCGDAHDKEYRQAVVACGDGCKAALEAEKYISARQ